ncbi:hypothetical protein [Candidatus Phytoplasma solani]|uniref:Variable membrane protein n=1 Tax=Candidatus Phytoplasma solani TaxID=69896 RepID=A0A421NV04_9MOLU|nr:hypothetical protein [Candidatus Phytoplasma solani]RMI87856.1 hypothetical protein PSSA1_v1c4770 [Candidatus Phytoplasma solani]
MPNFKNKKRQLLFLTSCLLPLFLFFFNMFFFNIVHAQNGPYYFKRKPTTTAKPDSTTLQDSVDFTAVTVEKQDLSNFTKPTTETITVTQAEVTSKDQNALNKFLKQDGSLTVGTDVTITFNANERKATLAVVANSTKAQGSVVFTNVTVEKQDLSTFTKTPTDQAITVTQAESTNPTQATVNKFLKTADKLTINTDVTITFNTNERKATLTAAPNSTKAQGSVDFTAVTVEKPALNTLTKPTTETITVTQAEVTSKDQNALNKFLKQAGSLTVNTDATIEFDTTNKKATITATPNSTQAKGSVVFTNVTVEKQEKKRGNNIGNIKVFFKNIG